MPAITTLLWLGLLLSAAGTLGFALIWQAPGATDFVSLRLARRTATTGRWAGAAGLVLYLGTWHSAGPLMLDLLLATALAALASVGTKANPAMRRTRPDPYAVPYRP